MSSVGQKDNLRRLMREGRLQREQGNVADIKNIKMKLQEAREKRGPTQSTEFVRPLPSTSLRDDSYGMEASTSYVTGPSSDGTLPPGFFDSEVRSSTWSSTNVHEDISYEDSELDSHIFDDAARKAGLEPEKKKRKTPNSSSVSDLTLNATSTSALPTGFFDDQISDAVVRGVAKSEQELEQEFEKLHEELRAEEQKNAADLATLDVLVSEKRSVELNEEKEGLQSWLSNIEERAKRSIDRRRMLSKPRPRSILDEDGIDLPMRIRSFQNGSNPVMNGQDDSDSSDSEDPLEAVLQWR